MQQLVEQTTAQLRATLTYRDRVNLAMHQNAVPIVAQLTLHNDGSAPARDLTVTLTIHPDLAPAWTARLQTLDPGTSHNFASVDLQIPINKLVNIIEREAVELVLEVAPALHQTWPLEILAYNEWSGAGSLPELLAAFVMPNHPAIERLLPSIAQKLDEYTKIDALDGYQSKDPRRPYMLCAALYAVLQDLGLTYVIAPASFERSGQKIQTPDQVLDSNLGNCLDIAVLEAAILERCGLHALICVIEGHAFAGAWLFDTSLPEPATDDPLRLRKRVELNEMIFFDSSVVTQKPPVPFERAQAVAIEFLNHPDKFIYAVDIKTARNRQIRPLPARLQNFTPAESAAPTPTIPAAPAFPQDTPATPEKPADRLTRWKTRLLDLSLRNALLNYRPTRKTLPLQSPDLAALEAALSNGTAFNLLPRGTAALNETPEAQKNFLATELQSGRLHADTVGDDLQKRLIDIYRAARESVEESGANTLYLALGMLAWYESPSAEQRRLAPLLLYPVDLVRGNVHEAFRLRLRDEEPHLNITLVEKLARDFNIAVPPAPLDDEPIEITFRRFRQAIVNVSRWEVLNDAHLGLFSFNKYLMWLDLEQNTDALARNPIVAHLINGSPTAAQEACAFETDATIDTHPSADYFAVLDADSSQMAAIYASENRRSFVLEGPPGTGKSQTITNLIAHNLARGRRVLFVSEKMAALEVVYKRLSEAGLAPFCLELHSNKARKSEVLERLGTALAITHSKTPESWTEHGNRLQAVRAEFNAYVEALHRPRPLGQSVFGVTAQLIALAPHAALRLGFPDLPALTADRLHALTEATERLCAVSHQVGTPSLHPWAAIGWNTWKPDIQNLLPTQLDDFHAATIALRDAWTDAASIVEVVEPDPTRASADDVRHAVALMRSLLASPAPATELLASAGWQDRRHSMSALIEHGCKRSQLWGSLAERWEPGLLGLPLDALHASYKRWASHSAFICFFTLWSARRTLTPAARGPLAAPPKILADLAIARDVRTEDQWLKNVESEGSRLLQRVWNGAGTDWQAAQHLLAWVEDFRQQLTWLLDRHPTDGATRWERLATMASDQVERFADDQPAGRKIRAFLACADRFDQLRTALAAQLSLDETVAWGTVSDPGCFDRICARVDQWRQALPQLRDWCAYREAAVASDALGLQVLTVAHARGEVRPDNLVSVLLRSLYEDWLNQTLGAEPTLRTFYGMEHERKIERFRELDVKSWNLAREVVFSRLAAAMPNSNGDAVPDSELGKLSRELKKKRAQMALRKLFSTVPNVLSRIKPCLLMSPMSVAQYLDASYPAFDLVVFDEASQIPVWDAIGAIGRAPQAIVVGDPKQLPPTSFFTRADGEFTDDDDFEKLESILDECMAARLPDHSLRWHYRSRHEDLITFSNYHYYGGNLLTFPTAERKSPRFGVSHRLVNGQYDRSKSRTNEAEAAAVVDEIVRRLEDPRECARSIGVVTFSQAQQVLIEDLLERARHDHPAIESYFKDVVSEPVFIKNLENVQGDERDVILFSVGYGPDSTGRVSMHFGPLNRQGGERRLNVAVTRAREQIIVFSTLRADQIDLGRTNAVGVRHLKTFLDYAARGPRAIQEAVAPSRNGACESPFEQAVCDALERAGCEVHRQVGSSGFRIDLAVVRPERPGSYLLGIECDGATYHSARCARDRDRLREAVLRQLGWRLYRVWSTDWWLNADKELQKLLAAIEAARANEQPVFQTQTNVVKAPAPEMAPADSPIERNTPADELAPEPITELPPGARYYDYAFVWDEVRKMGFIGPPESFEQATSEPQIRACLLDVLRIEAPMSLEEAARRIGVHWGIQRVTAKTQRVVNQVLARWATPDRPLECDGFLWNAGSDVAGWREFRVPRPYSERAREAQDIAPEEIANAAAWVLQNAISLSADELARQTAKLFGIARLGTKVRHAMQRGIDVLAAQGRCRVEEERVVLSR